VGFDLVRWDNKFAQYRRGELLEGVSLVVDVGSFVGSWADEVRVAGYRGPIIAFEPQYSAFKELSGKEVVAHRVALGSACGSGVLNVAAKTWSSSLLPMASLHEREAPGSGYVTTETVAVRTLDSYELPRVPTYLKIDAQGSEGEVLAGAVRTLKNVKVVEIEVSFETLYEGQPLAWDIHEQLTERGFRLCGFGDSWVTDRLLQIDAFYVK
jgi:FkbM family methyltransferase